MVRLHSVSKRVAASRPGAAVFAHLLPVLDRAVSALTRGRHTFAGLVAGVEVVELTTTGARTGRPRTVPLLALPDGERLVVVGSNWGRAAPPAWVANLHHMPAVSVARGGVRSERLARVATADERARLWPLLDAVYPGYRSYRLRAGRPIELVVLEPAVHE